VIPRAGKKPEVTRAAVICTGPAEVVMVRLVGRMPATACSELFSAARSTKSAGEKLSGSPAGYVS
jgi:hypothetical protein